MWKYNNEIFDESLIKDNIGFVYLIINKENNKIYVGKKVFNFTNRKKISQREKLQTKTRKVYKTTTKESDWKDYYGSNIEIQRDVSIFGGDNFERFILKLCKNKKQLSYYEIKYQILHEVLEKDSYNLNILGKFFRKDV